jgi:hypothetical protein
MATLKSIIEGAEDNNSTSEGQWKDWPDEFEILNVYAADGIDDDEYATEEEIREILSRAIETNGESLERDLPAYELKVWGQNFAGSFWDRLPKPSEKCKAAGLKSLNELAEITGESVQTLNNWYKNKPQLFKVVLAGAVSLKA